MSSPRLPRVRASELVGRGWLNTGGKDLTLADLRGRITVLDFWTFCCVNCLHVLDELRELEARYRDVLLIVGVHSPKFVHEADPVALAAAVDRYEVHHPVLDDPELTTWSAYSARAWPTLVVVDPEGYIVAHLAGEGHAHNLEVMIGELVAEHTAKGTLRPISAGQGPYVPPIAESTTLRFPGKAIRLPVQDGAPAGEAGNLLVADAGHHSLAELAPDGETLVRRIGSGERGLVDGGPDVARFSEPNGLCLVPRELWTWLDYDVLVADTVNHALRGVRLADGRVTTVAGTGEQYMVGAADNENPFEQDDVAPRPSAGVFTSTLTISLGGAESANTAASTVWLPAPRRIKLSSPWDIVWSQDLAAFVVAMAGNHSLWVFDDKEGSLRHLAGTMNEGLVDGPAEQAWFAQTSGLAAGLDGRIWMADSEVSALRWLDARSLEHTVGTAVGQGLFDFGHRDGPADTALLQHPLGVAVLPDGSVAIADTYNGAVRRWAPSPDGQDGPGEVTTLARDLAEPSGLLIDVQGDGSIDVLVVESAAHRLTRLRLPARLTGEILDAGAHRTKRPVSEIGTGEVRLDVVFTPATGQKYDDRYGPSTRLQVSASPPELLLDGAGDAIPLERVLRINPAVTEGVLHVTAQAASCDDDPAIDYPACHLNQQDWGVPVIVVDGGPAILTLPLRG